MSRVIRTDGGRPRLWVLVVSGAAGFWLANLVISLTPVAADYRAALSIEYVPMLVEALIGGVVIATFVSGGLVLAVARTPTRDPLSTSLVLSLVALVTVTVLIEAPAKFSTDTNDALHYFLVGTLFNCLRILVLGVVIARVYGRLDTSGEA